MGEAGEGENFPSPCITQRRWRSTGKLDVVKGVEGEGASQGVGVSEGSVYELINPKLEHGRRHGH